jgi:hypothetical protein
MGSVVLDRHKVRLYLVWKHVKRGEIIFLITQLCKGIGLGYRRMVKCYLYIIPNLLQLICYTRKLSIRKIWFRKVILVKFIFVKHF